MLPRCDGGVWVDTASANRYCNSRKGTRFWAFLPEGQRRVQQIFNALAGQRGGETHGHVGHEVQAFLDAVQHALHAETVSVHQVPLVHHHDQAPAGIPGQAAMWASCAVAISVASVIRSVMSLRRTALTARSTLYRSMPRSTCPGRRIHAVSTKGDEVVLVFNLGIQRVAGGPGHRANDAALLSDDCVG